MAALQAEMEHQREKATIFEAKATAFEKKATTLEAKSTTLEEQISTLQTEIGNYTLLSPCTIQLK